MIKAKAGMDEEERNMVDWYLNDHIIDGSSLIKINSNNRNWTFANDGIPYLKNKTGR